MKEMAGVVRGVVAVWTGVLADGVDSAHVGVEVPAEPWVKPRFSRNLNLKNSIVGMFGVMPPSANAPMGGKRMGLSPAAGRLFSVNPVTRQVALSF